MILQTETTPANSPNYGGIAGMILALASIIVPLIIGYSHMYFYIDSSMLSIICCISPVLGIIASIVGCMEGSLHRGISSSPSSLALFLNAGVIFLGFFILPNFLRTHGGHLAACESNLKNIATSLEMYATDYYGNYPPELSYLTSVYYEDSQSKRTYMKTIPSCPGRSDDIWSDSFGRYPTKPYGYIPCINPDNFTLWCGNPGVHKSTEAVPPEGSWPQYSAGAGLILKP